MRQLDADRPPVGYGPLTVLERLTDYTNLARAVDGANLPPRALAAHRTRLARQEAVVRGLRDVVAGFEADELLADCALAGKADADLTDRERLVLARTDEKRRGEAFLRDNPAVHEMLGVVLDAYVEGDSEGEPTALLLLELLDPVDRDRLAAVPELWDYLLCR